MPTNFSPKSVKPGAPIILLPGERIYGEPCRIQPLTFSDIESIKLAKNSMSPIPLYDVINRRITLNIRDLLFPDLKFILLWHRANSYGDDKFPITWKCPQCEEINRSHFIQLDDDYTGNKTISDEYNHNGMGIKLSDDKIYKIRLGTIGDEIEALDYISSKGKGNVDLNVVKKAMMFVSKEYGTIEDRIKLLDETLSAKDNLIIDDFEKYFEYGVSSDETYKCSKCRKETRVRHELTLDQFLTQHSNGDDIRSRLQPDVSSTPTDGIRQSDGVDGLQRMPKPPQGKDGETQEGEKSSIE